MSSKEWKLKSYSKVTYSLFSFYWCLSGSPKLKSDIYPFSRYWSLKNPQIKLAEKIFSYGCFKLIDSACYFHYFHTSGKSKSNINAVESCWTFKPLEQIWEIPPGEIFKEFNSKEIFWFDVKGSLQIRILVLSERYNATFQDSNSSYKAFGNIIAETES